LLLSGESAISLLATQQILRLYSYELRFILTTISAVFNAGNKVATIPHYFSLFYEVRFAVQDAFFYKIRESSLATGRVAGPGRDAGGGGLCSFINAPCR
jgi:hypothetical protein